MIFEIFGEFAILKRKDLLSDKITHLDLYKDVLIIISNSLQEMTKYTHILAAFSTDHSPILITLSKINEFDRGKGFWKFNNSSKKMKTMLKQ